MTDKELRRLSRADLIEIIYELRKNEARLKQENEALKQQLGDRQLKISEFENLAELSESLSALFEYAQTTANQYLREIAEMRERTIHCTEQKTNLGRGRSIV